MPLIIALKNEYLGINLTEYAEGIYVCWKLQYADERNQEGLNKWRENTMIMVWNTHHCKDISFPWIDVWVQRNSCKNSSKIFLYKFNQDYLNIYMEIQRNWNS